MLRGKLLRFFDPLGHHEMVIHGERTQHVTDVILDRAGVFQKQDGRNGVGHFGRCGLRGLSDPATGR